KVDELVNLLGCLKRREGEAIVEFGKIGVDVPERTDGRRVAAMHSYFHEAMLVSRSVRLRPGQLTAFFTRAPMRASAAAVNSFSAKATGHKPPSSRFAASLKPKVAYLDLNFCASWKKHTTLPSL